MGNENEKQCFTNGADGIFYGTWVGAAGDNGKSDADGKYVFAYASADIALRICVRVAVWAGGRSSDATSAQFFVCSAAAFSDCGCDGI